MHEESWTKWCTCRGCLILWCSSPWLERGGGRQKAFTKRSSKYPTVVCTYVCTVCIARKGTISLTKEDKKCVGHALLRIQTYFFTLKETLLMPTTAVLIPTSPKLTMRSTVGDKIALCRSILYLNAPCMSKKGNSLFLPPPPAVSLLAVKVRGGDTLDNNPFMYVKEKPLRGNQEKKGRKEREPAWIYRCKKLAQVQRLTTLWAAGTPFRKRSLYLVPCL